MERSRSHTKSAEEHLAELKTAIQKDLKMLGGGAIFEQYLRGKLSESEIESQVQEAIGDGDRGTPVLQEFQQMGEAWDEYKALVFDLLKQLEEVQAIHTLEKGAHFVVWILTKTDDEARNGNVLRMVRDILLRSAPANVPLIPIVMPAKHFDKSKVLKSLHLYNKYHPDDIKEVFC